MIANGYQSIVDQIEQLAISNLPNHELDFPTILKIFMADELRQPYCHTCNKPTQLKWNRNKGWPKYCSMKCCQNDPAIKEKVKIGLAQVNWDDAIESRKETMLARYGAEYQSQLPEAKESLIARTKAFHEQTDLVIAAKEKRAQTNLERYGVSHLSMDADYHCNRMNKAIETKKLKSHFQKEETITKYRISKLGAKKFLLAEDKQLWNQMYCHKKYRVGQIANKTGLSWDAIHYTLNKHGIAIDPERETINRSIAEIELFDVVRELCSDAIPSYKIGRKELDIFIPSKNLGIEFNGLYWHSERHVPMNYHADKVRHFAEHGIRVVQIWEDSFRDHREMVVRFLKNLLGGNSQRIGARKTVVRGIGNSEYWDFLNQNHLLGQNRTGIKYGLFHGDCLVAVMGFNKIASNEVDSDGGFELARFSNSNVSGAFGKLLKHFIDEYQPRLIKSFADLEIVDPNKNVYLSNGFIDDGRLAPDYSYYNPRTKQREHKKAWRKSKCAYRDWETDRKSTRLNSSHSAKSRMPSSA